MTQSASDPSAPLTPLPALARGPRWYIWLFLWIPVALALAALLRNNATLDTHLWLSTRWAKGDADNVDRSDNYTWKAYHAAHLAKPDEDVTTRPFYMDRTPPFASRYYLETAWAWKSLRFVGTFPAALIALAAITFSRRHNRRRAAIITAIALAVGNLSVLVAYLLGRYRPTHIDGANRWVFLRGLYDRTDISFPSGHATAAFALAAVMAYFLPRGKWLYIILAAGCALSRVVMEAHFYSDVLAGSALGWTITWLVTRKLDQKLPRDLYSVSVKFRGKSFEIRT